MADSEETANDNKRKAKSAPPDGYVCRLCNIPGHWIQVCPTKKTGAKRRRKSDHVPVPGKDPSPEDIEYARKLQEIPPPKCKLWFRAIHNSLAGVLPPLIDLRPSLFCRFLRSSFSLEQGETVQGRGRQVEGHRKVLFLLQQEERRRCPMSVRAADGDGIEQKEERRSRANQRKDKRSGRCACAARRTETGRNKDDAASVQVFCQERWLQEGRHLQL